MSKTGYKFFFNFTHEFVFDQSMYEPIVNIPIIEDQNDMEDRFIEKI